MKVHAKEIIVSILLIMFSFSAMAEVSNKYKLSSDDVISVTIFDEPDLSLKEVRVSSSGTISMPLVGQIIVRGMTLDQAEKIVRDKYLGDYLKKPDVSITIVEYRQFYVNGEVNKPGGYSYRDGMTVQRAITLAGGFTERASRTSIVIAKENSTAIKRDAKLNESVEPGDVITVEESFF